MRGRPPGGPGGGGPAGPGGMGPGGVGGTGGMTGPGGGSPGRGRDGSRPSDEELKRMRDLMREVLEAPARLVITDEKASVTFTETDGRMLKYATSGKTEKHQLTNGTVETRTRWQASILSIETKLADGTKVTRTFELDARTESLIVTTAIESSRGPRDMPPLKAFYDRASNEPR